VGHGTYRRQVLGLACEVEIGVRRYRCRACGITISVLPDLLHPGRWYGAWAILGVLSQWLADATSSGALRPDRDDSAKGWSGPRRWARELLGGLWPWRARELGASGSARDRLSPLSRLRRLLGLAGAEPSAAVDPAVIRALAPARPLSRRNLHVEGRM
jgi:hypothetical protein